MRKALGFAVSIFGRIPTGWRAPVLGAVAAIALVMTMLVSGVLTGGSAPKPLGFTDQSGHAIQDTDIQRVNAGFVHIPDTVVIRGSADFKLQRWIIEAAVTDPGNLRKWQLCGIELRAEANYLEAHVQMYIVHPIDKPGGQHADPAETWLDHVSTLAYLDAARIADANHIACEPPGPASAAARIVRLTGLGAHGNPVVLLVPDASVMLGVGSIEQHRYLRDCPSTFEKEAATLTKEPIDKTMWEHYWPVTYWMKADYGSAFTAEAHEMRQAGITC
jgi:hypothetical protein